MQPKFWTGNAAVGIARALKIPVLGAFKNLDILGLPVGGLKIGVAGSEVAVTATAAELNTLAALNAAPVPLAVDTVLTKTAHANRTIVMGGAGSARTFTLPAAMGTGDVYRFVVGAVNTSNYLVKAAAGTQLFKGKILGASTTDSATDAARTWTPGATDDTVTLNGTTTGGVAIGDWLEFEDCGATLWAVRGVVTQSGVEATPFSDTVA